MMKLLDCLDDIYELGPQQRLMLEALILPAPRCEDSFVRWLAAVDFNSIDFTTMRLVPALLKKFGEAIVDDGQRKSMASIYRHSHLRTSLILSVGHRVLERMCAAGIDFLLFKGAAIAPKYHNKVATRPMADIDVLLRREDIAQVEVILRENGFRYGYPEEKKRIDLHSHDYIDANWSGFDLHWYSLYESIKPNIDAGIWARAEFLDWGGLVVKVMAPEDLLLTSIINGVRDKPMRSQWIHDVATIVKAEPVIQWETVWEEAGRRNLLEPVFHALNLVRGISREVVPDALLQELLDRDPEFREDLLKAAAAAGGEYESRKTGSANIEVAGPCGKPGLQSVDGEFPRVGSDAMGLPGQIRYYLDGDNVIRGLFLQWRYLRLIAGLFEVNDRRKLDDLIVDNSLPGGGYLGVPPGVLSVRADSMLTTYSARLALVNSPANLVVAPGEMVDITVEVENDSTCCWFVFAGSESVFGLSYHLLTEDGVMMVWDTSRAYLAIPRRNHVAFIEPSQILTCQLKVVAPLTPGRYVAQLDIVQELVTWFSQKGVQFPKINLEVTASTFSGCYAPRGPDIAHEIVEDKAVFLDARTGAYYSTEGYGALIWKGLMDGYDASRIIRAFAASNIFPSEERVVEQFIHALLAEKIIRALETAAKGPEGDFSVDPKFGTQHPVLTRHGEPGELIRMHPVRDTSARAGWPDRRSESGGSGESAAQR